MKTELPGSRHLLTIQNDVLNAVRRHLARHDIISYARILRQLIHFGPWRTIPKLIIRQLRPAKWSTGNLSSLLPIKDVDQFSAEIRRNSVAVAGILPSEIVDRLRKTTEQLPVDDYQLMHVVDNDVRTISEDPGVMNVLRTYFACEPVLLESTITVSAPAHPTRRGSQNYFHFDYAGWESLNVFVYLTDVKEHSSHHDVAKGSHRDIRFHDVIKGSLTDEDAMQRFGTSIQPVLGTAGTIFFENTEAFHRQHPGDERRVMLNLLYTTHRNWLSHGRTSRKHAERRNKTLECIEKFSSKDEASWS